MDDHWLGALVGGEFIEQMEKTGIEVCGENGEYHTLVVDGPIFSKRIEIGKTMITRRGTMAFLHVIRFTYGEKA